MRRLSAVVVLLAGIALGLWLAFGAPHEWDGGLKLLRFALGLGVLGLVGGSAKLMFPGDSEGDARQV
ncbi:hypothetical protein [Streptomyces olivoreticuli]|uniref:hypothetical protein n=1 Tax=Streptomyces olivoreticuli TaxID=68246 RepID=UPI0013C2B218|nr:hypothetical protein [Streptomyces olivoreticuli]